MKRIVILGAGESGAGAAVLAKVKGFETFVSDMSAIKDKYKELLDSHHIAWEEGHHTEELILNADEVIKSPGIPNDAPLILKLKAQGTPVISEIEFAGRYTDAKMICITGSNGKTTTTSLIYHIFKSADLNVGLAGNIGKSLALQVAEEHHDYYIIELSSFQLDNMYNFRANIAVLMNITPDHLDRYDHCMQNYIDAKFRITQNQTTDDAFIFWNDDPIIKQELAKHGLKAHLYPFAAVKEDGAIAYVEDHEVKITEPIAFNMEQEELALTGQHNLYNSLAAGISANLAGITKENIRKALSDFKGVEHRLEKVARVRGIDFINDSKATNVNSCWYALQSMTTKTVLILGGKDKGNDYTEIEDLVREKCSALVYLGLHNEKLHDFFDRFGLPVADVQTGMKDAVEAAYKLAKKGETVLLSPCCASFDLFKSYEDRGDQFKKYEMDLLKSIFKGDKVIWIIFLCLCLISIIEVFSAASTLTYKSGDHWGPITQHSIILMVGAVVVVFLHNVPYKWFQVFPVFLYPISLVLLAFVTLMGIITGDRVNGAARWMTFMGLQFQPSELAKMAVIIAVSFILSKRQDEEGANPKAFKYIMILTGLVLLLIAPENLSTAMLLFGVVFMMMFIGRVAAKKLLLLAGGLVLIVALGVGTVVAIPAKTLHNTPGLHRLETWQNRIKGFFDKDEVPAAKFDIDKDAQIAHARIAIATSHVVGKGPGNSIQRDFLSQAFSDFIFAIVIEEMGLIGGIFVVFLYLCLLMRAGRIAQKCERTFPAFLVMGIALLLVSQAILNMMVAVGLFPVTGQPLPLVSKGGTSTLINCAYIGMILSVSRYTAHLEEQKAHDAQIQMQIEAGTATSEAQAAAEPTAQILNSDAKFEDEHDSSK
jgi:UDP-N-acetylmuramoylalanine--D-glutamate ligase